MRKAKKNIPVRALKKLSRKNYIIWVGVVTFVCILIFLLMPGRFGAEQEYFGNSIRFLSFFEKNGSMYAQLDIYVNESGDCLVRALYLNKTEMQTFKLHGGNQRVSMLLDDLPEGNTRVEFFLNCSPQTDDINETI
jgi:hypothetical protein